MSIQTVLAHLSPLVRELRTSILPGGGDPALLFNAVVEAGYLVAAADGAVDPAELGTLRQAVAVLTDGDMSADEIAMLVADLVDLRKSEGEAARCKSVGEVLAAANASEQGLYLAAAIAYASGGLDARELGVMEKIAAAARVPGSVLATLATSVRTELARRGAQAGVLP
jgi:tellurite resistance protein